MYPSKTLRFTEHFSNPLIWYSFIEAYYGKLSSYDLHQVSIAVSSSVCIHNRNCVHIGRNKTFVCTETHYDCGGGPDKAEYNLKILEFKRHIETFCHEEKGLGGIPSLRKKELWLIKFWGGVILYYR